MSRSVLIQRLAFWAGSAAAAFYWLFCGWRLELALWDMVAWAAAASGRIASVMPMIDRALVLCFVVLTYALPTVLFAACVRLLHLHADRRTWAIPATGFVLLFVFLASESLILNGGPLDLMRVSTFTDAGLAELGAAILGLAVGSAVSWTLIAASQETKDVAGR